MADANTNLNLLTTTRWLCYFSTLNIDNTLPQSTICLNLTRFSIPEISLASENMAVHGYPIDVASAHVRTSDKTITLEYMLDSDLSQYKLLYKWLTKIAAEEGAGNQVGTTYKDFVIPIHILILSEYKNPVVECVFQDAWLQKLGELNFDYQDANDTPMKHNFTLKYEKFEFNNAPSQFLFA